MSHTHNFYCDVKLQHSRSINSLASPGNYKITSSGGLEAVSVAGSHHCFMHQIYTVNIFTSAHQTISSVIL